MSIQNNLLNKDRYIALLILFIGLLLIWGIVLNPILNLKKSHQNDIAHKIKIHKKLSSKEFNIDFLNRKLENINFKYGHHEAFFKKINLQKSENNLLQLVKKTFKSHNISVLQTEFITPRNLGPYSIIGMKFNAEIDATKLIQILYSLEKVVPVLIFNKTKIFKSKFQNKGSKLKLYMSLEAIVFRPVLEK